MKKNDIKILVITVLICLAPMVLGVALYNELPEQMPIHFTINDVPDNYAHKNIALFAIPLVMALLQFVCVFTTIKKTKKENQEKLPVLMKIFYVFIPIVTVTVYLLMIGYSLGIDVYIGKSVCLLMGILFAIIGNYMPKIDFETAKKITHPVPKDEKTFRKMYRIVGYSFVIIGIAFFILLFFL